MIASVSPGAAASTGGRTSVAEMKETSMTSRVSSGEPASETSAPGSSKRALVRSTRRTRESLRSFIAIWPNPDRHHVCRAVLQKAIGEPASRSAHIQAGPALNRDLPMIERCFQFQPAAADVRLFLAQQPDGRVIGNIGAGLVYFLLAHQHAPGQNQRSRTLAAGHQAPLNQQQIDADLFDNRLLLQPFPSFGIKPALCEPTPVRYFGSWQCYQLSPNRSLPIRDLF